MTAKKQDKAPEATENTEVIEKVEIKEEAVKLKALTNNTKGLRHVAGVKVLPGKSVKLSAEQLKSVEANPVAMAWVKSGDLSLA